MKIDKKSLILWTLGFIAGAIGYFYEINWLYIIGFVLSVYGILLIHISSKDKNVWHLLINMLSMTP